MGIQLKKPSPRLCRVNLSLFEAAIEWVRKFYAEHGGHHIRKAILDPYVEVWFFYDCEDSLVSTIDHATIEIVAGHTAGVRRGKQYHAIQERSAKEILIQESPKDSKTLDFGIWKSENPSEEEK